MAMLSENGSNPSVWFLSQRPQRRLGRWDLGSYQRRTYQEAEINFHAAKWRTRSLLRGQCAARRDRGGGTAAT